MKTVSVTGSSNGIGKAIVDLLQVTGYSVVEFDIDTDISIPLNRLYIVDQSRTSDIFINNAWSSEHPTSQNDMFSDILSEWNDDQTKHIINMGSLMKYASMDPMDIHNAYRISKKNLYKQTMTAHLDKNVKCKLSIAQPGFTETAFTEDFSDLGPMMKPSQVAEQILNIIESDVQIVETSFKIR
jgi:short-subunit dehydrogenase